jgi:hypothetical protein
MLSKVEQLAQERMFEIFIPQLLSWGYIVLKPKVDEPLWFKFSDKENIASISFNMYGGEPFRLSTRYKPKKKCGDGRTVTTFYELTKELAQKAMDRKTYSDCKPVYYKDLKEFLKIDFFDYEYWKENRC